MMRYTQEMHDWFREEIPKRDRVEVQQGFYERFGIELTGGQIKSYATNHKIHFGRKYFSTALFSKEEHEWFVGFVNGHSEKEIADAFEKKFGWRLTERQIKNYKCRRGLRSNTVGGRFEKGLIPANKGKTWDEMGYSDELKERMLATAFKSGNIPHNHKQLGYERIDVDGYVWVKINDFRNGNTKGNFKQKHYLIWEQANGRPVPPGSKIYFGDKNKRNFDIDNLVEVPKELCPLVNKSADLYNNADELRSLILAKKLSLVASRRKKELKE